MGLFFNKNEGTISDISLRDVPILVGNKCLDYLVNEKRRNEKNNAFTDTANCKFCNMEFSAYASWHGWSEYNRLIRDLNDHIFGNTECSAKRIAEEMREKKLFREKIKKEYKKLK